MQEPNPPLYCMFMEFPDLKSLNIPARRQRLESIKEEIEEQIYLLEELKEPEILRVEGYEVHQDCAYIVHERVDNILSESMQKLSYPQKISLFYDVFKGIKAIHGHKMVHRGIRPSIIGICEQEAQLRAKITNFSKAKSVNKYDFVQGE